MDIRADARGIMCGPGSEKMIPFVGTSLFVRRSVYEKLIAAQHVLTENHPGMHLKVHYAYRHPEVQKSNFEKFFEESRVLFPEYSEDERYEYVHHYMAIPDVGGHPVGGAVDITLSTPHEELDMGAAMADFSDMEKVHTFSKTITTEQLNHRLFLRDLLMAQGFAPYDFEWWHFSYGDREWACYYGKEETIYEPLDFRSI